MKILGFCSSLQLSMRIRNLEVGYKVNKKRHLCNILTLKAADVCVVISGRNA